MSMINSRRALVLVASLGLTLSACGSDTTNPPASDSSTTDQKASGGDSKAASDATPGSDAIAKADMGAQEDAAAQTDTGGAKDDAAPAADSATAADAAPSCNSCHGFPPSSGHHSFHIDRKGLKCFNCHHDTVDANTDILSGGKHQNGSTDIANISGSLVWDSTAKTCASSGCHGKKTW